MKPKIAIYTIALNEEKHVRRWYDSAKDADLLLIADTGSTDNTKFVARSLGIDVYEIEVKPWRFDVARNASLALIPENFDLCIQLDMDEILSENWRDVVTQAWKSGNIWPTYKHVTSRDEEGKPRNYQHYFKIHPRKDFVWKYPIHEVLVPTSYTKYSRELIDLEVDHLQDRTKPRSSYLNLLETAVSEMPNDWRMNHYLCREYMYNREWLKVLQTTYKSLELVATWDVEQASTYMWASEAAWNLGMKPLAEEWARKATEAAPNFYEAWHWRSHVAHLMGDWQSCFENASRMDVLIRQTHHLVKPEVWDWWGRDLMALSLHKLGFHEYAVKNGESALHGRPEDERLRKNAEIYQNECVKQFSEGEGLHRSIETKLSGLPRIFLLNLNESPDRLLAFANSVSELKLAKWHRIANARPLETLGLVKATGLDKSIHKSLEMGYQQSLDSFLDSGDEYGLICEDDINLSFAKYWPFTWEYKLAQYRNLNFDAVQLSLITATRDLFNAHFHPRREGVDWSSGATLVSKRGAKRILEKLETSGNELPIESVLYDELVVFTEPLFTVDSSKTSTLHQDHIEKYHEPSWEELKAHFISMNKWIDNIAD